MKYAALAVICTLVFVGCVKNRTSCVYELPDGFTGWVLIEYERPDAPPVPKKDGKLVFHIGPNGRMATSSKLETGWGSDEYVYDSPERTKLPQTIEGHGGLIWGGVASSSQIGNQKPRFSQSFFVGTEAAAKNSAEMRPKLE
jgi:hypothetical protein